jgi:hypothetical protein
MCSGNDLVTIWIFPYTRKIISYSDSALRYTLGTGAGMLRRYIDPSDLPLLSEDLDHCQKVFDVVREELDIERGSEKEETIAASIIHFYKQGVRDEQQLLILARTAAIS